MTWKSYRKSRIWRGKVTVKVGYDDAFEERDDKQHATAKVEVKQLEHVDTSLQTAT